MVAPLWSGGRCKVCDTRFKASQVRSKPRSPLKGTKTPLKPKSPSQGIKKKSDKRVGEEKKYKELCDWMDAKPGKKMCFFCGNEIKGKKWDHHHLAGRVGDKYLLPGLIVHTHARCHFAYHNNPFKSLPWRYAYLQRLRLKDEQLYQRELFKLEK